MENKMREWTYTGSYCGTVVATSAKKALKAALEKCVADGNLNTGYIVKYENGEEETKDLTICLEVRCAETNQKQGMHFSKNYNRRLVELDVAYTAYIKHSRKEPDDTRGYSEWLDLESSLEETVKFAKAAFNTAQGRLKASNEFRVWVTPKEDFSIVASKDILDIYLKMCGDPQDTMSLCLDELYCSATDEGGYELMYGQRSS